MKRITMFWMLGVAVVMLLISACERRSLGDDQGVMALIPVKIDWSQSNIPVTDARGNGHVHRVSLRFFPKDGSAAFDRYLEMNIIEGEIEVPIGEYSVVVFNESIHDIYWEDAICFSNVDSYTDFAATIILDDLANYPFYKPLVGEEVLVEPFRLASWSLDDFTVTREVVSRTRSTTRTESRVDDMENALTKIVMRALTYNVNVTAHVENLASAQLIQGATRSFAKKVYMASAQTEHAPATHVFKLNNRCWDEGSQEHGTVTKSFLSFGRLPEVSECWLNLDVVLIDGSIYEPPKDSPRSVLLHDVTEQVHRVKPPSEDIDINIDINVSLLLPFVTDGIYVGDWEDEAIRIQ